MKQKQEIQPSNFFAINAAPRFDEQVLNNSIKRICEFEPEFLSDKVPFFIKKILHLFGLNSNLASQVTIENNSIFIPLTESSLGLEIKVFEPHRYPLSEFDYIFTLRNKDASSIFLPSIEKFKQTFDINLEEIFPEFILKLYESLSIKHFSYGYGVLSNVRTEINCHVNELWGFPIDSFSIPLSLNSSEDEDGLYLTAGVRIAIGGLTFVGMLSNNPREFSLHLSHEWKTKPQNVAQFINVFTGNQLPKWLIDCSPEISFIEGRICPLTDEWNVTIKKYVTRDTTNKVLFTISDIEFKVEQFSLSFGQCIIDEEKKFRAIFDTVLIIGSFKIPIQWDNSNGINASIQGTILKEDSLQLLSFIAQILDLDKVLLTQFNTFLKSILTNVSFSVSPESLMFSTKNMFFEVHKFNSKWIAVFDYKKCSVDQTILSHVTGLLGNDKNNKK